MDDMKLHLHQLIHAVQDRQKIQSYKKVAQILGCDIKEAMELVRSVWLPSEQLRPYQAGHSIGYYAGLCAGRDEAKEDEQLVVRAAEQMRLWVVVWYHRHGEDVWPVLSLEAPSEDELARSKRVEGEFEPDRGEYFRVIGPFDPDTGE
jgi:hypothetical protein